MSMSTSLSSRTHCVARAHCAHAPADPHDLSIREDFCGMVRGGFITVEHVYLLTNNYNYTWYCIDNNTITLVLVLTYIYICLVYIYIWFYDIALITIYNILYITIYYIIIIIFMSCLLGDGSKPGRKFATGKCSTNSCGWLKGYFTQSYELAYMPTWL